MTKKESYRLYQQENVLMELGFTKDEAEQLRRISITLQRWHELECGNSNEWGSWAIERDEEGDGLPYMVHHHYRHGQGKDSVTRTRIPHRETGARKRLEAIIKARNTHVIANIAPDLEPVSGAEWRPTHHTVSAYIQGDPRGAALYIIRPGDVPEGADVNSYYTRGICVY
jgi:hypothetical protein